MENSFGGFLKQKRIEKNLTQKELARLMFVSESAVSKWESNVSHPDITLLPRLAEILGVTEHELITASIDIKERKGAGEKVESAFLFVGFVFLYFLRSCAYTVLYL